MLNLIKTTAKASYAALAKQRLQYYASFQVRDILYERNYETGTVLLNFAKHIAAERHRNVEPIPTKIRYADYFPISNEHYFRKELSKTEADQLASLFVYASTYRSNAQPDKFAGVLNALDEVSVRQLMNMQPACILNTLYGLLFLAPHWLTRMDFYYAATERLAREFQGDEPKEHFVQLCFYLALVKARSTQQSKDLKSLLDMHLDKYLPQLGTMDLAIVSNAAYKTSTQVESALFAECLEKKAQNFALDEYDGAVLVTLIKAMRFQRVQSPEVCKHLTEILQNPQQLKMFDPRSVAHIYAYFAENLWDHEEPTARLVEAFFRHLKSNSQREYLRAKDVATFIWCCAQLNTKLSAEQLQEIEEKLMQKYENDEFKYFSDQLVDACLSLWILGHQSRALLQSSVQLKANAFRGAKLQPKVDSRVTVLLTAANIEEPEWLEGTVHNNHSTFNIDAKVPAYIVKNNQELNELVKQMPALEMEGVRGSRLVMPINGINIPSILMEMDANDEKVFIECLKPQQTLRFSKNCVSVLRLKVRLLEALGHKVLMLTPAELRQPEALKDTLAALNCDKAKKQSLGSV